MAKKKKRSFKGKVKANVEKRQNESSSYGYLNMPKGVSVYTVKPGATETFDVIPYIVTDPKHLDQDKALEIAIPGEPWYKKPFKVHKNIGADDDSFVCLKTFGQKCPICNYIKSAGAKGADQDDLKELRAKDRILYVVRPKDNDKFEDEFHILDMSYWLFQETLDSETGEDEDYEDFAHPEVGYTLKVKWKKKKFGKNEYAEARAVNFEDREEQYEWEIADEAPNLDKVLKVLSYEELENIFLETGEEPEAEEATDDDNPFEDDEEEDEKPKKKPSKKEKKESKKPDLTWDDVQDMDEEELTEVIEAKDLEIDTDDYEDDEEGLREAVCEELDLEKPKKKSKAPKKKDEAEEEDEEEDEKPKKKSKAPKKKASETKCPHGYKFGVDTDEEDECEDCPFWDDCIDQKEEGE